MGSEMCIRDSREMLATYRELIRLRKTVPDLSDPRLDRVEVWHGDQHVVVRRGRCLVAANLASEPQTVGLRATPIRVLLATEPGVVLQRDRAELPPESAVVIAVR